MRADFKNHLIGMMSTGHRHEAISQTLACRYCGERMKKAEGLYTRMRREKPELFIRAKPEFQPSQELKNDFQRLVERVQKDKLYRRHIELSSKGTIEEQNREADLANEGYYTKHYEEGGNIKTTNATT